MKLFILLLVSFLIRDSTSTATTDICDEIWEADSGMKNFPIVQINECAAARRIRLHGGKDFSECPHLNCDPQEECVFGREVDQEGCPTCDCVQEGREGLFHGDIPISNVRIRDHIRYQVGSEGSENTDPDVQHAVASNLPLWKFYRRGNKYVIPYVISSEIEGRGHRAIESAAEDFEKYTCLRLEPRKTQARHIRYFDQKGGCYSTVGATQLQHTISLSSPCWNKGTVIHETLHALGFWHEHSRPDRDEHVDILYENVYPRLQFNFLKFKTFEINSFRSGYDVSSVMQYSSHAFTRNGEPTMVEKNTRKILKTQRSDFSVKDLQQLNVLYGCPHLNYKAPTTTTKNTRLTPRPPTKQTTTTTTTKYVRPTTAIRITKPTGTIITTSAGDLLAKLTAPDKWSPDGAAVTTCFDRYYACFSYAMNGQCRTKVQIRKFCCKSCSMLMVKTKAVPSTATECTYRRSDCSDWTKLGACKSSPAWMRTHCCGACEPTTPKTVCRDADQKCPTFARLGHCYGGYQSFMEKKCRASCKFCTS